MNRTAEYWIEHLNLEPHPEGGFFREVYRSEESIGAPALPKRYESNRNFGTSIYFLLRSEDISHFHRLQTDEIWHFYHGSPLSLHIINAEGEYATQSLGKNPENGEQFQFVVPKGAWFGATVNEPESYTLVGCTMAPGFDFADFELGNRKKMLREFPQYEKIIKNLTIN